MKWVSITNCFFGIALFSAGALAFGEEQQTPAHAVSGVRPVDQRKMQDEKFGLVIHGGAGTIDRSKMTPEKEREYRAGLEHALMAGHEILKSGGSCWRTILISTRARVQYSQAPVRTKWTQRLWTEKRSLPVPSLL